MTLSNSQTDPANKASFTKTAIRFFDDARVLKFAFYALLFGVIATLVSDYRELIREDAEKQQLLPFRDEPVLPSYTPRTIEPDTDEARPQRDRPDIKTERETLNQPMTIELGSNGILKLTGSVTVGTAERFREKIAGISEYVTSVELNSPGGSVFDALEISTLIRKKEWITIVRDGNLCASSCPLIFAGGKKRIAEENAAIGVHQVFAIGEDKRSNSEAISGTQHTTAKITRHLETMGIDPVLWIHALETPPQNLFYLNRDELEKFRLVTK